MFLWVWHAPAHKTCPADSGWNVLYVYLVPGTHYLRRWTQQAAQALISTLLTAAECRVRAQLAIYYSGDSPSHQQGVGPPSTAPTLLSVRAARAVSLVSRAPPLTCLCSVSASGAIIAADAASHRCSVPTKSLQNSCFIGRAWPNFPAFCRAFRKIPTKMFLRYMIYQVYNISGMIYIIYRRCCEPHSRFGDNLALISSKLSPKPECISEKGFKWLGTGIPEKLLV